MFKVNKDLCLACGRCAITCFRGAISLEFGQAEIDQSKCNGCGMCAAVCPHGAIQVEGWRLDQFEAIVDALAADYREVETADV